MVVAWGPRGNFCHGHRDRFQGFNHGHGDRRFNNVPVHHHVHRRVQYGRDRTVRAARPLTFTAKTANIKASALFTVTAPAPTGPPPVSSSRLRFGVATEGGAQASAELDQVATLAGESPSIVLFYKDFAQPAPLADLDAVRARGATPLVTWEPWTWGGAPWTSRPTPLTG